MNLCHSPWNFNALYLMLFVPDNTISDDHFFYKDMILSIVQLIRSYLGYILVTHFGSLCWSTFLRKLKIIVNTDQNIYHIATSCPRIQNFGVNRLVIDHWDNEDNSIMEVSLRRIRGEYFTYKIFLTYINKYLKAGKYLWINIYITS